MARPDRENVWMQALRSRPVIIVIIVTFVFMLLAITAPLIFNNPAFVDGYNFEKYSEIARSFGGYFGPFVALLAAFLTFMAFYIQFQANESIRLRFESQQANAHFYKMLDIHVKNVDNLNMKSFRVEDEIKTITHLYNNRSKKNDSKNFTQAINEIISSPYLYDEIKINYKTSNPKTFKVNCQQNNVKGINVFNLMLKDFHFIYYVIDKLNSKNKINVELNDSQVLRLSYNFFFWGTNSNNIHLDDIKDETLTKINDYLHKIRKQFRKNKGHKYTFNYKTEKEVKVQTFRFIPISGHSIKLARYYRHLYQTVVHLYNCDENDLITESELKTNLDTLRAQLSNEEQLLLYYNYMLGFGKNWDKKGDKDYLFLSEYRMIHNIPLYNNIAKDFENPLEHFKEFIKTKQKSNSKYRLFEWNE